MLHMQTSERRVRSSPRLVVFDVEGVLIPKRRYMLFEVSKRLSLLSFMKLLWAGFLYEAGLISLKSALQKTFKQLHGLEVEDLFRLYKKVPLIPGVREVFERLKTINCRTALISSGLPQPFVEYLASQLNADYAVGFRLEVEDGRLAGRVDGDVVELNGKSLALEKIIRKEGLTPRDCVVVADDRNNLSMFRLCGFRIGYNSDFLFSLKSDAVVKENLRDILPFIIGESSAERKDTLSKRDFVRETVHIGSYLVAVVSAFLPWSKGAIILLIILVMAVYVASELARMLGVNVPLISTLTWNAAVTSEIYEFVTSPIFFALGIVLALAIFPVPVGYAGIAVVTFGDGFATLFGKKFGRHAIPYNRGKRVEGTLFGFLFAFFGAWLFVGPLRAFVAAAVGMLLETVPLPVNDNLTIPLVSGLSILLIR